MSDAAPSLVDLHTSHRWPRTTLRSMIDRRRDPGFPELPLLSANLPIGVVLRNEDDGRVRPSLDLSGYLLAEPGDLVMNPLGKPHGSLGVSQHRGITSPAYFVARPRQNTHPRFLHYLMRSRLYISEYERVGKYMPPSQFNISWKQLTQIPVYLPSHRAQRAIADFLDRETGRIDALVAKKRRLIELLEEKRTALISHVVTKGLDPTVPIEDSGVRWCGQVPSHWQRKPLKLHFRFSKGTDAQRLTKEYIADHSGQYPVYSGQTASDGLMGSIDTFDFDVPGGAILVSTVGANAMTPRLVQGKFSLSQNCALMTPNGGVDVRFVRHQLEPLFRHEWGGIPTGMQPSLRIEDLRKYWLVLPPVDEQRQIGDALAESLETTSALVRRLGRQLDLLAEYRQALITAAVTGQIEVYSETGTHSGVNGEGDYG